MTIPRVAALRTLDALHAHLESIGVRLPADEVVDPDGVLSSPVVIRDAGAGRLTASNRFAALPMEGWDGTADGRPSDLVRRRWARIGSSGCGLVWGEATAVRPDGRANPRQLVLNEKTVADFSSLRRLLAPEQIAGLQLTHSGRYSRPVDEPTPRTAYRHPVLDERVGAGADALLSDEDLDELVVHYVSAAVLAREAGFDFVDVKHCHGYLLHELLSARGRPGRYGGDLGARTRFLREVVAGIRRRAPDLAIAVRLSAFDFMPFTKGPGGAGVPCGAGPYAFAFGGDGTGLGIDLGETHRLLSMLSELGIGLVGSTAGSPYYNPHIQRPAFFPPSDGYAPPEDPLAGVARQIGVTAELAHSHPDLVVVGAGYSYLQQWIPNVAQAVIASGGASMVGLGRLMLAYPDLPADVLCDRRLQTQRLCRTFSDCTTAPRNGLVSGCYPLDTFYKERPERASLLAAKQRMKQIR